MTNLWDGSGDYVRSDRGYLPRSEGVTTPSRPYLARRGICRPMGWRAPRAMAYPTAAAWFQRPSRHRKRRAWTAQRQPEKPAQAARGRTRWPCEPTWPHREAKPLGRCCSRPAGSLSLNRCSEIFSVVLITCTHGTVRLLHSRAHPGRPRQAPRRSNTATPGRRRWSCGQYP